MNFRSSKILKIACLVLLAISVFVVHRWWTAKNYAAELAAQREAESPEVLLQEVKDAMAQFSAPADPLSDEQAADPAAESIRRIDRAVKLLLKPGSEATAEAILAGRLAQMKTYFMAAQRQPDLYAGQFELLSAQMMEDYPETTAAVEASILRFAGEHDLAKPIDNGTFQALKQQASGYANQRNGAALYSFVSHQLYSNGQIQSAKAVLDAGTTQYRGKPGWNHLFEQKFQQGHLRVPQATTAGGVFESPTGGSRAKRRRS